MGKSSPSTPAAPSASETAANQGAENRETAIWNSALNNVNQITPYGTLSYTLGDANQGQGIATYDYDAYNTALDAYNAGGGSSGSDLYVDGSGNLTESQYTWSNQGRDKVENSIYEGGGLGESPQLSDFQTGGASDSDWGELPQWTSEINLTPEAQAILDSELRQQTRLGEVSEGYLDQVANSVSTPYSYDGLPAVFGEGDINNAQMKAEEALYSRLDPQFARDEEALRTRLVNQGISVGSEAYNTEMERFNQAKTDARIQTTLSGQQYGNALLNQSLNVRNQAISEYDAQRKAPLNEYIGLSSGVQVQNPQFQSQSYGGAAPVDYGSLAQQDYQNQIGQYNASVAQNNQQQQNIGNFLGTAATAASLFSDERLKEDVKRVGFTDGGLPVYTYKYKGDEVIHMGVMAQEVEKISPEAVVEHASGYKMVDYGRVS